MCYYVYLLSRGNGRLVYQYLATIYSKVTKGFLSYQTYCNLQSTTLTTSAAATTTK